jgi:hypothetical protein
VTTCEPGAREVFTQGFTVRPFSWAFLATRPAAISTPGLEVLVQEVIAAITTSPWPRSQATWSLAALTGTRAVSCPALPKSPASALMKAGAASLSSTRSCGRLGPAMEGRTLSRSSDRVSVNRGSGVFSSIQSPCSLA